MTDEKGQDDKILCVPHEDPNWSELRELDDLPAQLRSRSSTSSRSTSSPRASRSRSAAGTSATSPSDHRGLPRALAGGALLTRSSPCGADGGVRAPRRLLRRARRRPRPGRTRSCRCSRARRSGRCRRSAVCAPACSSASGSGPYPRSRARRTAGQTRTWTRRRGAHRLGLVEAALVCGPELRLTRAPRGGTRPSGSAPTAPASTPSGSRAALPRTGRSTATSAAGTAPAGRCATASSRRAGSPPPSQEATTVAGCARRGPARGAGRRVRRGWRAAGWRGGDRCAAAMRRIPTGRL